MRPEALASGIEMRPLQRRIPDEIRTFPDRRNP